MRILNHQNNTHRRNTRGQGLVEYALILVLVAVVVIVVLTQLGGEIADVFCDITAVLNPDGSADFCTGIQITSSSYNGTTASIRATYNRGYDPSVTLTAYPGGAMSQSGDEYAVSFALSGCPCTVAIQASSGETETVDFP